MESGKGNGKKERKPRGRNKKIVLPVKFPVPMRALWEGASPEEKERAHQASQVLLEVWLGRIRREEAAKMLGVSPLRIWQLSKLAVSGMAAGLLKQPRSRRKAILAANGDGSPDTVAMQKRLLELERETRVQKELIDLLKALPLREEMEKRSKAGRPAGKKNRGTDAKRDQPGAGTVAAGATAGK